MTRAEAMKNLRWAQYISYKGCLGTSVICVQPMSGESAHDILRRLRKTAAQVFGSVGPSREVQKAIDAFADASARESGSK